MKRKQPPADRKPAAAPESSEDIYRQKYTTLMTDVGDCIAGVLLRAIGDVAGEIEIRGFDLDDDPVRLGAFVAALGRARAALSEAERVLGSRYESDGDE